MRRLVILALLLASAVFAQVTASRITFVLVDPAGACTPPRNLQYNIVNGNLWGCDGTWTAIAGGGGGSGTVTNIATTSPITGGPITTTGTIACATCGVTGSPLSQFASTTSAQLAGVLSDETGTAGSVVFSVSPALTGTPTAPTASQNDNSTKLTTTAYTDLAVSNAIAGVNPAVAVLAAS